jgi:hypothetical protein
MLEDALASCNIQMKMLVKKKIVKVNEPRESDDSSEALC